jgi:heavy metal sensor kinase
MTPLSLRARLTIWYSLVLLAVLCLFGVALVWQQGRIGLGRIDQELDDAASTVGKVLQEELEEVSDPAKAAAEAQHTMETTGRIVSIFDGSGRRLTASGQDGDLLGEAAPAGGERRIWTAQTPRGTWRAHAQPLAFNGQTFELLVAAPMADLLRERRETQEAMWVGIPLLLLLAAGGGLWLASIGLRPITDMARRAADMSLAGIDDLGQSERHDELGQLARAFNGLVARLRQALQTQRQFMADASHELRTPVSVIVSAADVTLSRDHRAEPEYRDALAVVGTQARRLGRLVEDMLVLARADAGGYRLRPVDLYLNELAVECERTVDVLARKRGVAVVISAVADVPFRGDEDLLRRMVLNVVQNAVQHTGAGGEVRVDIGLQDASVVVRVHDQGPGVPEADRIRVFDRFVQLDAARRREGAGLGLPIARWIAEAHGGALDLEESGTNGSTFRITLPLANAERLASPLG